MNKIIAISGSSGVGKTTISRLISIALPNEKTLIFSGDDLHKWERGDKNWKTYTHLNPEANNLLLGYEHLKTLKSNNKIVHHSYNHDTGKFDSSGDVYPSKFIVYEDAMMRRGDDEKKYITTQRQHADVIIRFKKNDNDEVILTYDIINTEAKELMNTLKVAYDKHFSFINVCNSLSTNFDLVQSRGGNVSYKINDKLIITSSGSRMKDITTFGGHCICNIHLLPSYFDNEDVYRRKLLKSKLFESFERPSMETGMHLNLDKDIIHTHPIYLNTILCSKDAENIIGILFGDFDYEFVSYSTPGVDLSNAIGSYRQAEIYFLENHGLVVCSDDLSDAYNKTKYISEKCKQWLKQNATHFHTEFDGRIREGNEYLFPDAVALSDENLSVNGYMIETMHSVGLSPKYLMNKEIEKIQNMESEKYRSQLV